MLHQLHQTYLLLAEDQPARSRVRDTRARRWASRRRRLRDLLRAPAGRIPMGVLHV
jgi:hypothetical protein